MEIKKNKKRNYNFYRPLTYITHKNVRFRKPTLKLTYINHLEMRLENTEKDISITFEKLAITATGGDHCKTLTTIFSHLKSKTLVAMNKIREKERRPDIDATYEHIMKSEASNAGKNLIETIITELTKQNVIINKKTCHGLDSFYKSSTAKQSIDFNIIKPEPKSNNISNGKLTPQKQLNKSLSQSCQEISGNY